MKETKGLGARKAVARAVLATVIIVIGFGLAGCGEQMAGIEDQQLRLQAMVEANTAQIAAMTARIEENQDALQAGLEDLRSTIRQVVAQTAAVGGEQLKLHEAVQNSSRQMTSKITVIEQSLGMLTENQHELQAGIQNLQSETRKIGSDMASDITTVTSEQARLYEAVQNNSRQLADNTAMIEQDHQQWQGTMEGLRENIRQVTVAMNALGEDLSKLQQVLQANVHELVSMMETSGQEQLKFREKTQATLRAMDDSLNTVKQNQNKLQSQIKDVQNSADGLRDVPEALAKFADELARIGIRERAEIMDVEPSSSSPPAEANSVE